MPIVTYHRIQSPAVLAADIISAVEFDSTGNYLATGDKGGRVVLFERNEMVRILVPHGDEFIKLC